MSVSILAIGPHFLDHPREILEKHRDVVIGIRTRLAARTRAEQHDAFDPLAEGVGQSRAESNQDGIADLEDAKQYHDFHALGASRCARGDCHPRESGGPVPLPRTLNTAAVGEDCSRGSGCPRSRA